MKQILILCPRLPGTFDGVGDYFANLADHLSKLHIKSVGWSEGWFDLWKSRRNSLIQSDGVLLQYVPQLYLKKQALWLALWLLYCCVIRRKKLYVTVHEYAIPWDFSPKRFIGRLVMMLMMLFLGSFAERIIVTTGGRMMQIRRLLFWKKKAIHLIPVGTNIPEDTSSPVETQQSGDPVKLTLFGQPSGMDPRLLEALKQWTLENSSVRTTWIGRSKQEIEAAWPTSESSGQLEIQDRVSVEKVSSILRNTNIFLAPLIDGVSTRRTTVIAALAHGLPVIGTNGECTDAIFQNSAAFLLSKPGDGQSFLQNLESLIKAPERRAIMGQVAEVFFNKYLTWEVIAYEYRRVLTLSESVELKISVPEKRIAEG